MTTHQQAAVENDCEDQGFTTYDYGCNACPNKGWTENGKPIRYAIVPRDGQMRCERCGGGYGEAQRVLA